MKLHKPQLVHEQRILVLALVAGAPAVLTSMLMLWLGDHTPKVQWTLTVLILALLAGLLLRLAGARRLAAANARQSAGGDARRRLFDSRARASKATTPWAK